MAVTLGELAAMVGGEFTGDARIPICGAATLFEVAAGQLTFIDAPERLKQLQASPAAAAIVPAGLTVVDRPTIAVTDVHAAFMRVLEHFRPARVVARRGVSPRASVSPTARLAADVEIHDGATIADDVEIGADSTIHAGVRIMEGCRLAEGVTIFPNVVLYPDTQVGPRVTIHAGAIVGGYGFGYGIVDGRHQRAAQLGNVRIEADVEIGPNSTIDRGTYGSTVIGAGTKIDNLVQIAHNCRIGKHNLICAHVGIAGSTSTGDYVVIAGAAGIRDHVHIGDRAVITAMAGVTNNVPAGAVLMGLPATPIRDQRVLQAIFSKLPEMRRQLKELVSQVARLSANQSTTLPPEWLDDQAA